MHYACFGLFISLEGFGGHDIWLLPFFDYLSHYCNLPYANFGLFISLLRLFPRPKSCISQKPSVVDLYLNNNVTQIYLPLTWVSHCPLGRELRVHKRVPLKVNFININWVIQGCPMGPRNWENESKLLIVGPKETFKEVTV